MNALMRWDHGAAVLLSAVWDNLLLATLLGGVAWALEHVLTRRRPRLSTLVWSLFLLRLLLPPGLCAPGSLTSLLQLEPLAFFHSSAGPRIQPDFAALEHGGPTDAALPGALPWHLVVCLAWIAASLATAATLSERRQRLRRALAAAADVTQPALLSTMEAWRRRLGLRRRVRLVSSSLGLPPCTLGLRRPLVFLPREVVERSGADTLDCILGHELLHVRRCDDLVIRALLWLRAAFFFHPFVWLACDRLDESRELACDRQVLALGHVRPSAYARSLLAVLDIGFRRTAPGPALGASARGIAMRLSSIAACPHPRRERRLPFVAGSIALAWLLLPMAAAPRAAAAAGSQEAPALSSPVPGAHVTSPFGRRTDPLGAKAQHHDGVDLSLRGDDTIRAAGDGRVLQATADYAARPGSGNVVVLDHGNGYETFYAHLDTIAVEPGQRVRQGDVLGHGGSSGVGRGPHLHFEVWHDQTPVEPALLVEGLSQPTH